MYQGGACFKNKVNIIIFLKVKYQAKGGAATIERKVSNGTGVRNLSHEKHCPE